LGTNVPETLYQLRRREETFSEGAAKQEFREWAFPKWEFGNELKIRLAIERDETICCLLNVQSHDAILVDIASCERGVLPSQNCSST
jgi:hypothetical protein